MSYQREDWRAIVARQNAEAQERFRIFSLEIRAKGDQLLAKCEDIARRAANQQSDGDRPQS